MKNAIIKNKKSNEIIDFINIIKDTFLHITTDAKYNKLVINVLNCNAEIINETQNDVEINIENGFASYFYLPTQKYDNNMKVNLNQATFDLKVIDIIDNNNNLKVETNLIGTQSSLKLNLNSISSSNNNKIFNLISNCEKPNTTSEVICFGICKDESKTTFNIISRIAKGATKANVVQKSKILLMDEFSKGENNPILEIKENDIKASHAVSIGMIDEETIFYLTSRGLNLKEARDIICLGNILPLLNKINDFKVKEKFLNKFKERMI